MQKSRTLNVEMIEWRYSDEEDFQDISEAIKKMEMEATVHPKAGSITSLRINLEIKAGKKELMRAFTSLGTGTKRPEAEFNFVLQDSGFEFSGIKARVTGDDLPVGGFGSPSVQLSVTEGRERLEKLFQS